MNIIFKTEIAIMTLSGEKPSSYYNFGINGILFEFQDTNSKTTHYRRRLYPQLKMSYEKQFYRSYRDRDNTVITTIGIKDDSKIDIDKVKKRYEKLKSAHEEEKEAAIKSNAFERKKNGIYNKVKTNAQILPSDYLSWNNYDEKDSKNNSFSLKLNNITEPELQQIMYEYRKIKGIV